MADIQETEQDQDVSQGGSLDMIDEVAGKIRNYLYHYKPETAPDIGEDPSVQHIGPMAQDLLKVPGYAAAVKEGPNGLEVDTGRLALVNAGVIADLSRRVIMLEELIASIAGAFGLDGSQPEQAQEDIA